MALKGLQNASRAESYDKNKNNSELQERIAQARKLETNIIASNEENKKKSQIVKKTVDDGVGEGVKYTSLLIYKETRDKIDKIAKILKVKKRFLINNIIDEC